MAWLKAEEISSKKYTCGYCNNIVASNIGYRKDRSDSKIYICPHCKGPTYYSHAGEQIPGIMFGDKVSHLPEDIEKLYYQARKCFSVSSFSAVVLLCRKLLMNIAVTHGAPPGKNFIFYIEFLSEKGFVPPNGKEWVDHIRQKGNEAAHEIIEISAEDAIDLISFSGMLLKFVFEFPARIPRKPA